MARNVMVVEVGGYEIGPGLDLRGVDLEEARLEKVDLVGADLTGADLTGARASQDTTWPGGFDPVDVGVIFED